MFAHRVFLEPSLTNGVASLMEAEMKPTANYNIVRNGAGWAVNHDGVLEGEYETTEAAFESAVVAASNAIKLGYGVAVTVEPRHTDEPALG